MHNSPIASYQNIEKTTSSGREAEARRGVLRNPRLKVLGEKTQLGANPLKGDVLSQAGHHSPGVVRILVGPAAVRPPKRPEIGARKL